jgi:hypothetical protein
MVMIDNKLKDIQAAIAFLKLYRSMTDLSDPRNANISFMFEQATDMLIEARAERLISQGKLAELDELREDVRADLVSAGWPQTRILASSAGSKRSDANRISPRPLAPEGWCEFSSRGTGTLG